MPQLRQASSWEAYFSASPHRPPSSASPPTRGTQCTPSTSARAAACSGPSPPRRCAPRSTRPPPARSGQLQPRPPAADRALQPDPGQDHPTDPVSSPMTRCTQSRPEGDHVQLRVAVGDARSLQVPISRLGGQDRRRTLHPQSRSSSSVVRRVPQPSVSRCVDDGHRRRRSLPGSRSATYGTSAAGGFRSPHGLLLTMYRPARPGQPSPPARTLSQPQRTQPPPAQRQLVVWRGDGTG